MEGGVREEADAMYRRSRSIWEKTLGQTIPRSRNRSSMPGSWRR